jgi:hypothetical protein
MIITQPKRENVQQQEYRSVLPSSSYALLLPDLREQVTCAYVPHCSPLVRVHPPLAGRYRNGLLSLSIFRGPGSQLVRLKEPGKDRDLHHCFVCPGSSASRHPKYHKRRAYGGVIEQTHLGSLRSTTFAFSLAFTSISTRHYRVLDKRNSETLSTLSSCLSVCIKGGGRFGGSGCL